MTDHGPPAIAGSEQRSGRFQKGQSGNPAGKKPGTRNRATVMVEALMREGAETITNAVVAAAKNGDLAAARIILDRIAPVRKDAVINLDIPPLKSASDAVHAMGAIMQAVSDGVISPSEAATLTDLVTSFTRTLELSEFDRRLTALESNSG